jgi:hypothetical protein
LTGGEEKENAVQDETLFCFSHVWTWRSADGLHIGMTPWRGAG